MKKFTNTNRNTDPNLFEFGQTFCVAQGFAAAVHLQHERFVVGARPAAGAAGHGQAVEDAEVGEACIAAHLVDDTFQHHLVFGLENNVKTQTVISASA